MVRRVGPDLEILKGATLDVQRGERVAILGASGSGKTTLLSVLAGLDRADGGSLRLLGESLDTMDEEQRAALRLGRIGFVFQSFQLLPRLTALENVALPLELRGAADARARAKHWLERVGLAERMSHWPAQLSGGEQQRVAIARAFVVEPELLFADEPTGNLDAQTGAKVADLLFELDRDAGASLVLVTHDVRLAQRCDRRLALLDGRLESSP